MKVKECRKKTYYEKEKKIKVQTPFLFFLLHTSKPLICILLPLHGKEPLFTRKNLLLPKKGPQPLFKLAFGHTFQIFFTLFGFYGVGIGVGVGISLSETSSLSFKVGVRGQRKTILPRPHVWNYIGYVVVGVEDGDMFGYTFCKVYLE